MKYTFTVVCILMCCLVGCDSREKGVSLPSTGECKDGLCVPVELTATDIVVRVSGDALTYGDLESFAAVVGRRQKVASKGDDAKWEKYCQKLMRRRFALYPGTRLLVYEARRRGLMYATNDFARFEKRYAKLPAAEKCTARGLIEEDLMIGALRRQMLTETPVMSDEKLRACVKRIADYNQRATATNNATISLLREVRGRIAAGALTFDQAAKQYSEDEWLSSMGCEWGHFTLMDLNGEDDVIKVLAGMKAGDISDPVEGDGGYMLMRLDDKKDGTFTLSRIFRRGVAMMNRESVDELRIRFRKEACEKRVRELAAELLRANPPVYPKGTNFLNRVTKDQERKK